MPFTPFLFKLFDLVADFPGFISQRRVVGFVIRLAVLTITFAEFLYFFVQLIKLAGNFRVFVVVIPLEPVFVSCNGTDELQGVRRFS